MTDIKIRPEITADIAAIGTIIDAAFKLNPHSDGSERAIVDALRREGALHLSLVAEKDGAVVGQVAFSRVLINDEDLNWFGLGPVAVAPSLHSQGIGSALIRAGLAHISGEGAQGCVLAGDPGYYNRFGFLVTPRLVLEGMPPEYFMALTLNGSEMPEGAVTYHKAFSGT